MNRKLTLMHREHAQTREYMEMNARRGIVKDGAGTTLYNYFTEFGLDQISVDVVFGTADTPEGGAPQLIRVVTLRADEVTGFGDARLWSETTLVDLRVAEIPAPRQGDRIEIDGESFLIQGEPPWDRERLVWAVDLRLL